MMTFKKFVFFCFALVLLSSCNNTGTQKERPPKYTSDWESLKEHSTPDWFRDAKFGIYCHWGPYSVPAYETEWYSHWMYVNEDNPEYGDYKDNIYKHHTETYGPLKDFGYKDFIPMFKAEKFDAAAWAELFHQAGAQFAGPVSEHADGFAMWDSELTEWDSKDMGPKRDIMGELSTEIRKRGMKFIATYHRHWLWAWYPTWDETTDASNPEFAGLYGPKLKKGDFQYPRDPNNPESNPEYYPLATKEFNDEWLARLKEIVDKYEPDLVWFDNKMDVIDEEIRKEFLSYYYNAGIKQDREVVATYKFYDFEEGSAVLDVERARMSEAKDFPWLTDDSMDWGSWCHVANPDYKTTNRLIDVMVDIISKNGCLLLNITPRADGVIPQPVQDTLIEMGKWLKVNGEAVYGTRPWEVYGEGPTEVIEGHLSERANADNTAEDIRFTKKDNVIYAFILDWPGETVSIRSLGYNAELLNSPIMGLSLLGSDEVLEWEIDDDALTVTMPEKKGKHAFVLKIES